MKKLLIVFVACFMIACNSFTKSEFKDFFKGVYVRSSVHEFGNEYDTIIISALNNGFQLTRLWKYERVLDEVVQKPEYKRQVTTAYYDEKYRVLHENETGKRISIDVNEGVLFIGSTKFRKLKL